MTYTDIHEALAAYDDMLDELYPGVLAISASRIIKTLDPTAYRVGFHDFLDAEGLDMDELDGWEDVSL